MVRHIHPFPARMAPELAIAGLMELKNKAVVLDPMVGSGTVVRQASDLGHSAIGFDTDPLAVLMTKVWTTPVDTQAVLELMATVLKEAESLSDDVFLPWIDEDTETKQFVEFWFAEPQRLVLRRLAYVLSQLETCKAEQVDVLRLALSKIIITKSSGASLARDTSHSRPHKVSESSNFDVAAAFQRSAKQICKLLDNAPPSGSTTVTLGDARSLTEVETNQVDAVLTSPPYLNAIDYMRGHRLSLVWLGYKLADLRYIRSNNIGTERGLKDFELAGHHAEIQKAMGRIDELPKRYVAMVTRYVTDVYKLVSETARVLKPSGKAIFVVGDSCLKGIFIQNSEAIIKSASIAGLKFENQIERNLPLQNRYLPTPSDINQSLGKRMRKESIITFSHA